VIVPDGVLFGSSRAHVELRKKLIEEKPAGRRSFRCRAASSSPTPASRRRCSSFTRGAATERIWFYDMAHDGFSLDDKRLPATENDIPDILDCWRARNDAAFQAARQARLADLQAQVAPLKAERLALHGEINRLTFESAIAADLLCHSEERSDEESPAPRLDGANAKLAALDAQIGPAPGADRPVEPPVLGDQEAGEGQQVRPVRQPATARCSPTRRTTRSPQVTLERLLELEQVMTKEIASLGKLLESGGRVSANAAR